MMYVHTRGAALVAGARCIGQFRRRGSRLTHSYNGVRGVMRVRDNSYAGISSGADKRWTGRAASPASAASGAHDVDVDMIDAHNKWSSAEESYSRRLTRNEMKEYVGPSVLKGPVLTSTMPFVKDEQASDSLQDAAIVGERPKEWRLVDAEELYTTCCMEMSGVQRVGMEDLQRVLGRNAPRRVIEHVESVGALFNRDHVQKIATWLDRVRGKGTQRRKAKRSDGVSVDNEATYSEVDGEKGSDNVATKGVQGEEQGLKSPMMASRPHYGFLLHGKWGTGKSVSLLQTALWAKKRGWLVFYIPKASSWTDGGGYLVRGADGLYELPVQSMELAQSILATQGDMLAQLPLLATTDDVLSGTSVPVHTLPKVGKSWVVQSMLSTGAGQAMSDEDAAARIGSKIDAQHSTLTPPTGPAVTVPHVPVKALFASPTGVVTPDADASGDVSAGDQLEEGRMRFSLADLLRVAVHNEDIAPVVMRHFRQQLNYVDEFPILIAIDEYNAGYSLVSSYRSFDGSAFMGHEMALFRQWGNFNHGLRRGALVAAVSSSTRASASLPAKRGELFEASRIIHVGNLKDAELRAAVSHLHYNESVRGAPSDLTYKRIKFMTDGNPADLMKLVPVL